jgi:hypothetical protein
MRLLHEFVNLANRSDEDILDYARRFGVLGLCAQHNCPVGHGMRIDDRLAVFPVGPSEDCHPAGWPAECLESTDQWRIWSNTFGTLLRLATALRTEKPGELEDWYSIAPRLKQDREFPERRKQAFWAGLLAPINEILDFAPRRLRWGVDAGSRRIEDRLKPQLMPALRMAPINYYAALWVALSAELAFAASGSKGWSTCQECGRMYQIRNKNRKFCTECGRPAAARAASKRFYENHRKGKRHGTQKTRPG